MGFRFRKSFKIFPGIKLNINKNSYGVTIGPRGLHTTLNSRGTVTHSIGVPGSGLSYSTRINKAHKTQKVSENKKKPIAAIVAGVLVVVAMTSAGRGRNNGETSVSQAVQTANPAISQWTPTPNSTLRVSPKYSQVTTRAYIPDNAIPDESIYAIVPNSTHEYEASGFDGVVTIHSTYSLTERPDNWETIKSELLGAIEADPVVTKCNLYSDDRVLLLSISSERTMDQYVLSAQSVEQMKEINERNEKIIQTYVVNMDSNVFHSPSCHRVSVMSESNKMFITESRAYMFAHYSPCNACTP